MLPTLPIILGEFTRSPVVGALSVAQIGLQVYALFLLFTKPGSGWFRIKREIEEAHELQLRVQAQQDVELRQKIISLRYEGFSYYLIAQDFNEQKIPIPERHSEFKTWSPELVKLLNSED